MFDFLKPLELPPQLQWKRVDEPELIAWTIRARNYNTLIANCMFFFLSVVLIGTSLIIHSVFEGMSHPWRTVWPVSFYMILSCLLLSMTHQKMNFAYRFTHSGLECCEWKDFPKWALPTLRWIAGITAIIFLFMATIDPSFLIGALVGPGGIGLMYLQMAYSKNFRAMHTQYHHLEFRWDEFTQIAIATNRELVDLKY